MFQKLYAFLYYFGLIAFVIFLVFYLKKFIKCGKPAANLKHENIILSYTNALAQNILELAWYIRTFVTKLFSRWALRVNRIVNI